jgi:agmatinase
MDLYTTLLNYLTPPGDGVYTLSSFQEIKHDIQKKIFQCDSLEIHAKWKKSLQDLKNVKLPLLLGVCSDSGGGILRGSNWGPLFLRQTIYSDPYRANFLDIGDIKIIPSLLRDEDTSSETVLKCKESLYKSKNSSLKVAPLSITEDLLSKIYLNNPNQKIFTLGGDHSISYALTKAYIDKSKRNNKTVAIIQFDAHTDLLSERQGVDITFASWAYHILKELDSPQNLFQIGTRCSTHAKKHWTNKLNINQYWIDDFKEMGAETISQEIIKILKRDNIDEIYISFDIDAIDNNYVTATGTPEANGLQPHEAMIIIQNLALNFPIGGADLMEVAPLINHPNKSSKIVEPDSTLMVANSYAQTILANLIME